MTMKLSRLLLTSRNQSSKNLLHANDVHLSDAVQLHTFTSRAGISTAGQNLGLKGIVAPYTVYKGKAALSVTPVLPTFTKLDSGLHVVDRRGVMMLKFIPAIGERKYDWEKKQKMRTVEDLTREMFALNPTEVGSLISLGSNDSCEFFHDPSMLSSNAGQVRKSLTIKPYSTGGGYMISLTVMNNILQTRENFSVPFTTAEFAVVKTACSYALPHILGWDQLTNKLPRAPAMEAHASKVDRRDLDAEWDK